jgi:hypothetical protein
LVLNCGGTPHSATVGELLEAVFSMWSDPRLYNQGKSCVVEYIVQSHGCTCNGATSELRPLSPQPTPPGNRRITAEVSGESSYVYNDATKPSGSIVRYLVKTL